MESGTVKKAVLPLGQARDAARQEYRKRGIFYFLYRSLHEWSYPLLCLHSILWLAHARLFGTRLVHFIGDSHTKAFEFRPRFVVHHIGQATAHNLNNEQSSSGSKRILQIVLGGIDRKLDVVAMVFGEIDCRIHFHYQFEKNKGKSSMDELMGSTIRNYGAVLKRLRDEGFAICVIGVPPAGRQENIYKYPFYGSPELRSGISRQFNGKLKEFCKDGGFAFIDIHSQAADAMGFILPEYATDEIHLNGRIVQYVRGKLNDAFGLGL
jgi:hypothetical protein